MKRFDSSSGDVLADRRADYAEMLFVSGERAAAAELMLQALDRAPGWTYGWFRLGEMSEKDEPAAAARAWRMALSLDPSDRLGAALKLALSGEDDGCLSAMPPAFVETLFDQYAGSFEKSLVDRLGYRVPDLLLEAIRAVHPARFAVAVDLGCGTGLMGERLRPLCDRLEGYDISEAMLAQARAKNIYDLLRHADIAALDRPAPAAGIVAAADVFMYLGALEAPFAAVRAMLAPGGIFAFSVEDSAGQGGFVLRQTRRFAHSRTYVEDCLSNCGLGVASLSHDMIRMDRGEAVAGLIVLARA